MGSPFLPCGRALDSCNSGSKIWHNAMCKWDGNAKTGTFLTHTPSAKSRLAGECVGKAAFYCLTAMTRLPVLKPHDLE